VVLSALPKSKCLLLLRLSWLPHELIELSWKDCSLEFCFQWKFQSTESAHLDCYQGRSVKSHGLITLMVLLLEKLLLKHNCMKRLLLYSRSSTYMCRLSMFSWTTFGA
jgi:hypothetical protein